ncbi:Na/Pi cotransporter family protein [Limibaculum sp. M0105]|uniref:Na/Pi cotransporter family protein n=1 Tax=Thermohalobaculum xanthum TaxID=2753746 RepID=A0A8J7SCB9_9RHOB|nr:Na/Pi cotransporter family protein [Thermohalobaculum xanthum]MBK0398161.1 Na/Pi cotransporter family protein [Thermohalobaculum xanthum]
MESAPTLFVLNMAAAAALLIWAVRLVRTGFERAFGGELRLWLRRSTANRLAAAVSGGLAAILMQSSTAVTMLMAGFVSSGAIGGVSGLAIVLGADVGSAVVAMVLNSRLAAVTPLLMLTGVLIFLRSSRRQLRQIGRIFIGLALVFLSLDLIRASSLPLVESEGARTAMLYLAGDPVTAFVLAACFAWLVHSSVAAVLLFATLASEGLLPTEAALAMVLGANLGGSFIAVVLTLKADAIVRRVVWVNLALRGGGAAIALILVARSVIPTDIFGDDPGHRALLLHLAFNAALLLVCLPLVGVLMRVATAVIPAPRDARSGGVSRTALDTSLQDQPKRAFACAVRELVHMGNRTEIMLRQAIELFVRYDDVAAQAIQDEFRTVARMSLDLRIYLAGVRSRDGEGDFGTRAFDLSGMAMNLEAAADTIARKIVDLAYRMQDEKLRFSDDGWRELCDFHDRVLRNVQHGIAVLMSEDVGLARELVEQKEGIREAAQTLEHKHLQRLQQGLAPSIETSAIHLDLLRSLKAVNASFAMIAYPLLEESGALLESRLARS